MAEKPASPSAAPTAPPGPKKSALTPAEEEERLQLVKAIQEIEHENKSIEGQISTSSPETLEDLKIKNKELKTTLLQVEKDLAAELVQRKNPFDAAGISDKLLVFKTCAIDFCTERQIDPLLWKKLESL